MLRTVFILFLSASLMHSCSWFQQTPREKYEKTLKKEDSELFAKWQAEIESAMDHEAAPRLPYVAKGYLLSDRIEAFSLNTSLRIGEVFFISLTPNIQGTKVFAELYEITDNPEKPYDFHSASDNDGVLEVEVSKSGDYKILIAGEAGITSGYTLKVNTQPLYGFPVKDGKNTDAKSFWGAPRDGGARKHEGVDIFADKGHELVAVTDGTIERRDGGLGGKQIWLYDRQRRIRIYYAHLDEQIARDGSRVQKGEVVGTVGNTGNARTTPPHVHFGTYLSRDGAVDPWGFIEQKPGVEGLGPQVVLKNKAYGEVNKAAAKLRAATYKNAPVIKELNQKTPLIVLGAATNHFHVRTPSGDAGFINSQQLDWLD